MSKDRELALDEALRLEPEFLRRPSMGCFIKELIDEATFRPCRLRRLVFLPVELLAEAAPEAIEDAPVAPTAALTSLLLLEPADMSLAGPVAEAMEIFSSSNSAGPKKPKNLVNVNLNTRYFYLNFEVRSQVHKRFQLRNNDLLQKTVQIF